MISVDEAKRIVLQSVTRLRIERVPLQHALGRVLAEPIRADRDFPPADRSAMDGYAVVTQDCAVAGARLRVTGEVRAGRIPDAAGRVVAGEAWRIMTGSNLPPGADAVVPIEDVEIEGDGTIVVRDAVAPGEHVRKRRQDVAEGDVVLQAGAPIRSAEIAALASVGATSVPVFARPLVHVLSTGDEVVEPELVPGLHQVRNSNAATLLAQLQELGLEGRYLGIAGDEPHVVRQAVEEGLRGDLLLITGGVSAGAYDHVERTVAEVGSTLLFHQVAMKPGKPMLAARRGGALVLGLPGNPLSTYLGFMVFAAPALLHAMGAAQVEPPEIRVQLAERLEVRAGARRTYHLARVEAVEGRLRARRIRATGSGDVLALARANAWLITGEEGGVFEAGAELPALLWMPQSAIVHGADPAPRAHGSGDGTHSCRSKSWSGRYVHRFEC